MGSKDADPSNGPEWRRYRDGINPWKYQPVQDQVKKDQQENQESQARLRKWANTFSLQKLCLIWWNNDCMVVASDNNLKRGVKFSTELPIETLLVSEICGVELQYEQGGRGIKGTLEERIQWVQW